MSQHSSIGRTAAKPIISPARLAAFEILIRIGAGKAHSDDLLHSHWTAQLSPEDRNLTTALVMGVLRWQIALDARIASLLARPGQKLADATAVALRLGAFQLLHMDRIPAHAALNESVELCRAAGEPHATGMVNAILRTIARTHASSMDSAVTAHPGWLVGRWVENYGLDATNLICEYDQREPSSRSLFTIHTEDLPQVDDGSRLVAELAAAALPQATKESPQVWDACAAPGGKTLVLAARLPDARLLATDVSPRRLEQMKQRLRSFSFATNVRCEALDATDAASPERVDTISSFDLILCDVPCTGTGTLARNPEIRMHLKPQELSRQAARQKAVLKYAISRLAPGGRLIYSTCSLEPEENENVVESVLQHGRVRQIGISPLIAQLAEAGILPDAAAAMLQRTAVRGAALRTLPGTHPCDGFYAAMLEKVS